MNHEKVIEKAWDAFCEVVEKQAIAFYKENLEGPLKEHGILFISGMGTWTLSGEGTNKEILDSIGLGHLEETLDLCPVGCDLPFGSFIPSHGDQHQCHWCQDTRLMFHSQLERYVNCTFCPSPCDSCRQGVAGLYCESLWCDCDCHKENKCKGCKGGRYPLSKTGYVAESNEAERRIKRGWKQQHCDDCGLATIWLRPSEVK